MCDYVLGGIPVPGGKSWKRGGMRYALVSHQSIWYMVDLCMVFVVLWRSLPLEPASWLPAWIRWPFFWASWLIGSSSTGLHTQSLYRVKTSELELRSMDVMALKKAEEYTLPETNSKSSSKSVVGRWLSFWGPAYFQRQTVSFRECRFFGLQNPFMAWHESTLEQWIEMNETLKPTRQPKRSPIRNKGLQLKSLVLNLLLLRSGFRGLRRTPHFIALKTNGLSLRLGLVTHAAAVADIGDRAGKVGDVEHFSCNRMLQASSKGSWLWAIVSIEKLVRWELFFFGWAIVAWAFAKIFNMRACIYIFLHMDLNACFILFYDEMVCWLKTAYNFRFGCFIYRWSRELIYLVIVFEKKILFILLRCCFSYVRTFAIALKQKIFIAADWGLRQWF